jgi:NAD(P)-dependent dehydrogenase (short-subunit alcohol dehydrogenase family)
MAAGSPPDHVAKGTHPCNAGINALTRHIASRWGKEHIRCNAVAPGAVLSETMLATMSDEFKARSLAVARSSLLGRPADIAGMVAFFFSEDGEWINGQVIQVNGGAVLRD